MSDEVAEELIPATEDAHEDHAPVGTFVVMGFMVLMMIVLWVWAYGLLLARG